MKVLIASKFLHHVGGVETYVRWLAQALASAGHEVGLFGMTPPGGESLMEFPDAPLWMSRTRSFEKGAEDRLRSALLSVWSPPAGADMRRAVREFAPDIVHFHGTCYQLTPSVVQAVTSAGVPSVLTAHEFKLVCSNQTLFDDARGEICTDCVGASERRKVLAPLARSCMKGSRAVTLLGAVEGRVADRIWRRTDPRILAPSRFMRDQLARDGWHADRVDYLDLPWRPDDRRPVVDTTEGLRRNVVFLGRLAPVKGADLLLRVWQQLEASHPDSRLRILGDGSERSDLEAFVRSRSIPRVDFLGHCDGATVEDELKRAKVSVHPARWHENSPFSVRESLMAGTPAAVSDLGGMPEMVGPATGWVVPHDDEGTWRSVIEEALASDRAGSAAMAHEVELRAVTESAHLDALDQEYRREIGRHKGAEPQRRARHRGSERA